MDWVVTSIMLMNRFKHVWILNERETGSRRYKNLKETRSGRKSKKWRVCVVSTNWAQNGVDVTPELDGNCSDQENLEFKPKKEEIEWMNENGSCIHEENPWLDERELDRRERERGYEEEEEEKGVQFSFQFSVHCRETVRTLLPRLQQ